jgi:glycerol-3-phosphate dehydrogenase subunit B
MEAIECDLMIVGSGMAGMAASLFAGQRRIDTVQVGVTGEIQFASGLLDLLGVHPITAGSAVQNPWEGIRQLAKTRPNHPYARLPLGTIRTAMETVVEFLNQAGLPYFRCADRNLRMVTPVGTVKPTYAVPETMAAGVRALEEKWQTLLVDFHGFKGYSALQIKETLRREWPGLRTLRIPFPGLAGDLYAERMAMALHRPENRRQLAESIAEGLGGCRAVGVPAVLGLYRPQEVAAELGDRIGVSVFEIPTMPPGVTGLRLRQTFEERLPDMGIRTWYQQKVSSVRRLADGRFRFELDNTISAKTVVAHSAVLASGRFFGRGLTADRSGIRESLFGLPVVQPSSRDQWHHRDLLNPSGHPINRAGVEVDSHFRPLGRNGAPAFSNLTAAGSILAHQDWIREKCGSGLAIATAYGAVQQAISICAAKKKQPPVVG